MLTRKKIGSRVGVTCRMSPKQSGGRIVYPPQSPVIHLQQLHTPTTSSARVTAAHFLLAPRHHENNPLGDGGLVGAKSKKGWAINARRKQDSCGRYLLRHNHLLGMLKEAKAETRPMPAQQTRLSLFSLEVVAGVVEALRAERATVRRRPSSPTRWPKTRGASSREILVPSVACWVDPGPARPWPFGIGKVAHSAGEAYTV